MSDRLGREAGGHRGSEQLQTWPPEKVTEVRGDPEPGRNNNAEPAGLLEFNHSVPWLTHCVWEVYSMS